jgi:hypothetical protein
MERLGWFKFDPTKWLAGRIQRCSFEHQGAFMRLCCVYWANDCKITAERAALETGDDIFAELIRIKVVKIEGENVSISYLDECKDQVKTTSETNRANALKRKAKAMQTDANAMQMHSDCIATAERPLEVAERNDAEERREEERREEKKTTSSNEVATVFPEHKRFAMMLIGDANFRATAAMNQKILPISKVDDYIVTFHEHLAQEGKEHKSFSEFRKHFNSWLRIQTVNNIQPIHRYEKQ